MKFLVPNYSCLQNPMTRGLPPPDPRSLCPLSSTEFVDPHPPGTKFLGTPLTLPPSRADCPEIWNLTEPSGPVKRLLHFILFYYCCLSFCFSPTSHIISLSAIFLFRHSPIPIYLIHTHNYSKLYHVPNNDSHCSVISTVTTLQTGRSRVQILAQAKRFSLHRIFQRVE